MKSFATLALLAVAACAVDIDSENPYKQIFNAPVTPAAVLSDDGDSAGQDDGTVAVNVWETIDEELMELMTEVTALMSAVSAQGSTLEVTQVNFEDLMTSVSNLRTSNAANSASLATQKAIDESQDAKIAVLTTDITKLEHKVSELNNKVALLKLRVGDLPDLGDLTDRLNAIINKNTQLMMDVMTQADAIQVTNDDLVAVNMTLEEVEAARI